MERLPQLPDPLAVWRDRYDRSAGWAHAHAAIVEATAAQLANPRGTITLAETDPDAVALAAHVAGMAPLLSRWIAEGVLRATPAVADVLARHRKGAAERTGELDAHLLVVLDAFATAGVVPILLKGTHTASAFFPEPAARPRADIDLMIAPGDMGRANDALAALGYAPIAGHIFTDRVEWRLAGTASVPQTPDREALGNPWAVDLHTELRRDYYRGLSVSLGTTADLPLTRGAWYDRPVYALAEPALTAFLAIHGSIGITYVRLVRLVELVWVLRRGAADGTLHWPALARFLAERGASRFAYPALELAERLAPGTLDPDFHRTLQAAAPARMQRVVNAVAQSGMQLHRRSLDDRLMWAVGPVDTVVAALDALWPLRDNEGLVAAAQLYARRARLIARRQVSIRAAAS